MNGEGKRAWDSPRDPQLQREGRDSLCKGDWGTATEVGSLGELRALALGRPA